jgi:hypothetical protein
VTEATVQQVEDLIQADRRIMIDSVATALGVPMVPSMRNNVRLFEVSESVCMVGAQRTE